MPADQPTPPIALRLSLVGLRVATLLGPAAAIGVALRRPPSGVLVAAPSGISWPIWLAVRLPIAAALLASGFYLAGGRIPAQREATGWVMAAVLVALVALAGRLTLPDAQLLVLAGLAFLWLRSLAAPDAAGTGARSDTVAQAGRSAFLAATLGLGLASAAWIGTLCWHAARAQPDWAMLSGVGRLRVLAEVLLAEPSLRRTAMLWPDAVVLCGFSVGLMWSSVLTGRAGRLSACLLGLCAVIASVWLACTGPWLSGWPRGEKGLPVPDPIL